MLVGIGPSEPTRTELMEEGYGYLQTGLQILEKQSHSEASRPDRHVFFNAYYSLICLMF